MAGQSHTESDPKYLANAEKCWHGFAIVVKYTIFAIIAVLGLMAVFLL